MVRSIGADNRLRRREFLRLLPAGATFLASLPACGRRGIEALTPLQLQRISKDLLVIRGAVNTSLLTKDGAVLAIGGDPRPDPPSVERVLFTHHRRDVVWAARPPPVSVLTVDVGSQDFECPRWAEALLLVEQA